MNEKENSQEYSISVIQILRILLRYLLPILIITAVVGAAAFVISAKFIRPKYRAEAMIYVSAKYYAQGEVSTGNLSVAKQLVNTYSIILKTDSVLSEVVESLGGSVTASRIKANLSASSVDNTEIFRIYYVDTDRELAARVIDAVAEIAPQKIIDVVKTGEASVIQKQGDKPAVRISPNVTRNTAVAAAAAFIISAVAFVLISMLDTRVRTAEDLTDMFGYPVLGTIPTITADLENVEKTEEDDE